MPNISDEGLKKADLLTSAVENVFRKLIRFLVGRMSLVKLQEMIRYIYVEETEKKLKVENPGRNVPLTKLALITGLDTRTLVQVRKRMELSGERYRQQFLAELTPESAVVEAWAGRIRNTEGNEDRSVLEYGDDDCGFEKLVRATISTRGITIPSIIKRLLVTNSIEQDPKSRKLKLLVDHYSPYLADDEPNIVNAAFSAISNLISTIEHNVDRGRQDKLFQRQTWTFRLAPTDRDAFRDSMREMLESYEEASKLKIEPWEKEGYGGENITAGVGFYYFEESRN